MKAEEIKTAVAAAREHEKWRTCSEAEKALLALWEQFHAAPEQHYESIVLRDIHVPLETDDDTSEHKVKIEITPAMAQGLVEVLQSLPPGHAIDNATQDPDPVLDDFIIALQKQVQELRAEIKGMKGNISE